MRSSIFTAAFLTGAILLAPTSALAGHHDASSKAKTPKVCRQFEITGSNIPKTVCETAAQWKEIDAQDKASQAIDQRAIERDQRLGLGTPK